MLKMVEGLSVLTVQQEDVPESVTNFMHRWVDLCVYIKDTCK